MMNGVIFDSHAHYDADRFEEDRNELLSALPSMGVEIVVNAGTTVKTSEIGRHLADTYGYVYFAAGIHPEELEDDAPGALERISQLAKHPKCVAVGEIGLDYYWDKTHREEQKQLFEKQLILAKALDLPVIVHDRDAHGDTMEILQKHRPKGVLHCYSGSAEMVREVVRLGMYVGFTGVATFSNAKKCKEAIAAVPLDHILVETDCPYMAPVPHRGKRCDSSMIPFTAAAMAEIKGISTEEMLRITADNGYRLFQKIVRAKGHQ